MLLVIVVFASTMGMQAIVNISPATGAVPLLAGTAKGKQRFHWTLQTREAGTGVSTGRTAAMPRGEA